MIRLGFVGASDIAVNRFIPSAKQVDDLKLQGYASKTDRYSDIFNNNGIVKYKDYKTLIESNEIDAVYISLPPVYHYKYAKQALLNGKHVLLEKPFTINHEHTLDLINIAKEKDLAIHENYMFLFHSQIEYIQKLFSTLECQFININFGFPFKGEKDFRYNNKLGGGAFNDVGGYTVQLARLLLGDKMELISYLKVMNKDFDVDLYGSITYSNQVGQIANLKFGMNNSYKNEIEFWCEKENIKVNRVFTAGADYVPNIEIYDGKNTRVDYLNKDDHFKNSIKHFILSIESDKVKFKNYKSIEDHSKLMKQLKENAKVVYK